MGHARTSSPPVCSASRNACIGRNVLTSRALTSATSTPSSARQARASDRPVASVQFVGHGEYDQRRNPHRQHGLGNHQVRLQACRVQHQNDRIGLPAALEFAQKHVARDHLVKAARGKTVDAREIDQVHRPGRKIGDARPAFHGDAGIVRHPLAKTREMVEQRGLPRIGRTYHGNQRRSVIPTDPASRSPVQRGGPSRSVQLESRTPAASSELRTHRHDAVSLRSATSSPSTR